MTEDTAAPTAVPGESAGALETRDYVRVRMPARDTFAWTVLSALAGSVDSRLGPDDRVAIVLQKQRGASRSA